MHQQSIQGTVFAAVLSLSYMVQPSFAIADDVAPVTAIASHNSKDAAFIGYASGAVSYCSRLSGCTVLDGTPAAAVTSLDIPRQGSNVRAWVGYANGDVYFCTLTGGCIRQQSDQKWEQKKRGE
jgi:hypothetical protein